MKRKLIFFVLLFQSTRVLSHQNSDSTRCYFTCCRPDAIAPAGIMFDHIHEKGRFSMTYSFMDMFMKGNRSELEKISDDVLFKTYNMAVNRMAMQMHMVMPMYGITSRLSVMAMINYNIFDMSMTMMPAETMTMAGMIMDENNTMSNKMKAYGFGDTKINFLYNVLPECSKRLIAGIGVSLPTGDIDVRGETMQSDYGIFPYGMQLGSGSFDLLPSLVYVNQGDVLTFGVSTSATIRHGLNNKGYRWGNEYQLSPWLAFKLNDWFSVSTRADYYQITALRGYEKEINLSAGNDPTYSSKNYGIKKANIYLGVNMYAASGFFEDTRFLLEFGLPFYQNLTGVQPELRSNLLIKSQYDF